MQTFSDGQLAAAPASILAAGQGGSLAVSLANTSTSLTEAIILSFKRQGGTSRLIRQIMLAPLETAEISNVAVQQGDTLLGQSTDAATVDYVVSESPGGPVTVQVFDNSGSPKQTAGGTSQSNVPGASTAALGTTFADAAPLPSATSGFYPTTGADDAKGVILLAADQVTGRVIDIGNGVSNKILKVYGPAGAVINGAAANAAFSSASGKGVRIRCLSGVGNTWSAM